MKSPLSGPGTGEMGKEAEEQTETREDCSVPSWDLEASSSSGPSPAPESDPNPRMELPVFFPGSGISRPVTPSSKQVRPPEEELNGVPCSYYL